MLAFGRASLDVNAFDLGMSCMIELLKRFYRPFRLECILGPLSKLIEVVFDLTTPLVVMRIIDRGVGGRSVEIVLAYGGLLVLMACAGFVFTLVCQKMASRASQGMGTDMRNALFERVNALSYAEIDRFGTPSLITRITNDVNQVQLAIALGVRQLTRWPLLSVGSMIAAMAIDAKLSHHLLYLNATHRRYFLVRDGPLRPVFQAHAAKARSHRLAYARGSVGRSRGARICTGGPRA